MRNELGDAKQCGLRVSGRVRLRDWISDFSQVSLLIICCTEIVLLVRSRLKQLGWLHEGGGVWCVVAIEVTLSYDHASLLLIAVFLKWEFFMALKREMKQEIKNLRFFPPLLPSCPIHPQLMPSNSSSSSFLFSMHSGDRYSHIWFI